MTDRAVTAIEAAWVGVAPPGYGDNVHALVQAEHRNDDGELGIHFPALVYASSGVSEEEFLPDGRPSRKQVETFQLDFRAKTYLEARRLSAAFRVAIEGSGRSWSILADDADVDLVLSTVGDVVPRRVCAVTLLYDGG